MPTSTDYTALTPDQIESQLKDLSGWSLEAGDTTNRITKIYTFNTFLNAIAFMQTTAPAIDMLNHHPQWENVYNRLTVHLTSHDSGNRVTLMDIRLAALLEEHHAQVF